MRERKLSKSLTDNRFGGWGWSMIIYCMFLYMFSAVVTTDLLNVIPSAMAELHGWDANALLAVATPASILSVVGGFIFGRLVIKLKPRNTSGITLILTGALFAVLGSAPSVAVYTICLTLICFFAAGYGAVACPTFMANWFPRKKGVALGWATMGAPFSSAFLVPLFSVLLTKFGMSVACAVIGIAIVVVGVLTFFWAKNEPADVDRLPDNMELDETIATSKMVIDNEKYSLKKILTNKNTWLLSLGFGLLWMVLAGIISQFIPRMQSVGYSPDQAMLLFSITGIIAIPGSYIWGWLDSKFGTKKASMAFGVSYILALILLITSFNQVCVWLGCFVAGAGIGGFLNLLASMTVTVFGREGFMSANSVITPISSIVRVFAFLLLAMLLNISGGSFTLPYVVFIFIAAVGTILIACLPKDKK